MASRPTCARWGKSSAAATRWPPSPAAPTSWPISTPPASAPNKFVKQIGTLSGNPVAAAAGLATLKRPERARHLRTRLAETGRELMAQLGAALSEVGIEAQVIGEPAMLRRHLHERRNPRLSRHGPRRRRHANPVQWPPARSRHPEGRVEILPLLCP